MHLNQMLAARRARPTCLLSNSQLLANLSESNKQMVNRICELSKQDGEFGLGPEYRRLVEGMTPEEKNEIFEAVRKQLLDELRAAGEVVKAKQLQRGSR